VPPNFITTVPAWGARSSLATSGAAGERAAEGHLVRGLEVAADGQAAREPRHAHAAPQPVGEERGGRLAGHVRVRREDDLADAVPLHAAQELVDAQVLGLDAVERRERAAEHVVEAAVLVRPLERDEVDRLLDDADRRVVAACVGADRAQLVLGQVAALGAEADALLHVLDRLRERERLVPRPREEVEREPLRRALADAGQLRELGDEVVHGRREHGRIVPAYLASSSRSPASSRGAVSITMCLESSSR
jgi:hypothetical protein